MSVTRTITINVDPDALRNTIEAQGLSMAVTKTPSDAGGSNSLPAAWFTVATQDIGTTNTFTWEEEYGVYSTITKIQPGLIIQDTNSQPSDLDKAWDVKGVELTPSLQPPTPGAITVYNVSETPETSNVGIYQLVEGQPNPLCIIGVMQNENVAITPRETIKVAFTANVVTKQVIEELSTLVVTFDMTGHTTGSSTFQKDNSWTTPTYG